MRRTKLTALIAAAVMLISMFAVCVLPASAAATMTVTAAGTVTPGKTVTVNVALGANSGVMGATLEIAYDTDALALKSVANGNLFSNFVGVDESTAQANPFRVSVVNNKNVTAAGNVVVLTFNVLNDADEGNYNVTVKTVKAANSNEEVISIADAVGTVTVEKSAVLRGDVNGDGNVSLSDVLRLMKHLNGANVVIVEANADVNGSNSINLADVLALLKLL